MAKDYVLKESSGPGSGTDDHVWAFDLGKGSIGEAVRQGTKFLHKASLLIPADFAETKTAATRRRMWRTRQAHKAREKWLREVMQKSGIEVLHGRNYDKNGIWKSGEPADERLEREFAENGDSICYTSCLLRIKLLRGEKLEPWQIYKAFHSAIQRRGYDPNIPWKTRESRAKTKDGDEDEAGTQKRMEEFEQKLTEITKGKPEFHYPCYFDAYEMGLWDGDSQFKDRIDCQAKSTRNQIVPRSLVEKEVRNMVDAAAKQYPKLKGRADYLLYGPTGKAYASFDPKLRKQYELKEGGKNDWQGVLGQKIPRFDNRIIGKCVLIPRLNVCKIRKDDNGELHSKSRIAAETVFLMKLKNMRFQYGDGVRGLTAKEISQIFNDPKRNKLGLTPTQWRKWCEKLGGVPMAGQHEEVTEPSFSGRSRFCRPALEILKRLILSGDTPIVAYEKELQNLGGNTAPLKGLVKDDLKFLQQMGATWEGIYIPNQKLEALARTATDPHETIQNLIGSQNDPIVRHRLTLFAGRLDYLAKQFGTPNFIVLEFVREDFMGKKAKLEYFKFQRERANERAKAREEAAKAGAEERAAGLKMELLKAQVGECLYTGTALIPEKLDEYVIDHIVPRAKGGPDSAVNYVLTTRRANDDKGDQTPFEWLSKAGGWAAYVERVKKRALTLRNKKVQLLTSPDAETLVQKYTALAETAWISKLAQTIIGLRFGWPNGISNGERKVIIVSGGLTGRVRRKYKLNSLLNPDAKSEEEAETKNRNDDRHHALDAMVISFLPNWARDSRFTGFFKFPDGVHRELFGKEIIDVIPQFSTFEKAMLAETIYGREKIDSGLIVQRVELKKLALKPISPAKVKFDLEYARKQIQCVRDDWLKEKLNEFIAAEPDESRWNEFCASFQLTGKNGKTGSKVIKIRVNFGKANEFADLSKDRTGAWKKAKQGHKGQIIYIDEAGKPKIRPVYVFESQYRVSEEIRKCGGKIYGFFRSGCLVSIEKPIAHNTTPLKPGIYRLNTIETVGRAKVTNAQGEKSLPIAIEKFIEANLKPLQALEAVGAVSIEKQKANLARKKIEEELDALSNLQKAKEQANDPS
ncbi:MAG TPA: HNH endonuclease domain-containing protein [Verrucomicrobiae bacterium]|jgi:CRISPR-associated endonuclease Csn1